MKRPTTYNGFVQKVRKLNPDLSIDKVKNLAKELYGKAKEDIKTEKEKKIKTLQGGKANEINPYVFDKLDKEIMYGASTINEVRALLIKEGIRNYEITKAGKKGANTLIYIELEGGERLPQYGNYVVFN